MMVVSSLFSFARQRLIVGVMGCWAETKQVRDNIKTLEYHVVPKSETFTSWCVE